MAAKNNAATESAARELSITRIFDAPRHLVFKAWTEPERLMRWWGPHGHTTTSCKIDLRRAGGWRFCMRAPDGTEEWQQGVYREIVEPERLVFTYAFEDAAGKPIHQMLVTVNFSDHAGKTRLDLHQAVFETVLDRDEHIRGWNEALDHLATYVGSAARELNLSRIFDAPRGLVFEAWSKPEHLMNWFCPKGFTVPACEMDFRAGGSYRLCMRSAEGREHWVHGEYREIVAGERIVFTGILEADGNETLSTITFADHEGKTRLTVHQTYSFESDSTRGAPQGWTETLERLGAYVANNLINPSKE